MTSSRVNEIDLLRFFAAMSVVFFHYSFRGYAADDMSIMPYPLLEPFSKYGYLGVQLFFMISGFVILMTASNGCLKSFILSRVVRLYPAFWICCTITFIVTLVIGHQRYSVSFWQYIINMPMLNEFVGVKSIDGVYWSLFVEIRFYALIVSILLIRRIHQAQAFIIGWLGLSIILEIYPVSKLRYILLTDYSAFFIAGATYYLIWRNGLSKTRISVITISFLLAIYQSVNHLQLFSTYYKTSINSFIVAGIITSFFFVMMMISLKLTGFIGRNRWLVIGSITYPLYLLHQNIGFMIFNIAYPTINPHLLLWGTIIAAIISAYFVHNFIERKLSSIMKKSLDAFINRQSIIIIGSSQK